MINEFLKVVFKVDTKDFEKSLKGVEGRLKDVGKNMESFGRNMSMKVTAPIVAFGATSVKAFNDQEKAEFKLRAALEANGRAVDKLFQEYKDFASQLQEVTVVGDEASLAMLQVAENMGLTGDNAKRAVRNAIGLSSAFGISTQSAMRYTAMLEQGDTTMLNRYIPTLRSVEDEAERVAMAHDILANGFQTALAEANTFGGQMQQITNNFGDFREAIGAVIAESLSEYQDELKQLTVQLKALDAEQIRSKLNIAAFAAAIPLATWALGALIKNATILYGALKTLFLLVRAHPLVALTASVATLGVTFYRQARNVNNFRREMEKISEIKLDKQFDRIANATERINDAFGQHLADLSGANGIYPQIFAALGHLTGQTDRYKEALDAIERANFQAMLNQISEAFQTNSVIEAEQNLQRIAEILAMPGLDAFPGMKQRFLDLQVAAQALYSQVLATNNAIRSLPVTERASVERTREEDEEPYLITNTANILENKLKSLVKTNIDVQNRVKNMTKDTTEALDVLGDWGSYLTNIFDTLLFQTSKFSDVLNGILRQLASKAFLTFLQVVVGGGFGALGELGVGGFLKKVVGVNDALITSSGDIVKFHPDDNILAMKDFSGIGGGQNIHVTVSGQLRGEDIFISGTRGQVSYNR